MKTIILLCGSNEVGKTRTLKKFFGISFENRLHPNQVLEKIIDGKQVYAVSLSSPQELTRVFCNVEEVKRRISQRIEKCEMKAKEKNYVLIIPHGVYSGRGKNKGQLNERCVLEPIEWLRKLGFNVFVIYLRKASARFLTQIDMLVRKIASLEIGSNEDYTRQAKELDNFIKNL